MKTYTLEIMTQNYGTPSSPYLLGREALISLTAARNQVAKVIGAPTDSVFFTSGGTEANNKAIHGVMSAGSAKSKFITTTYKNTNQCRTLHDVACAQMKGYDEPACCALYGTGCKAVP